MEQFAKKVFQELPAFIPKIVETFSSEKIVIFKAKNAFSELKGFDSYKFIVTSSEMPAMIVEKDKYHLDSNIVLPINPYQAHASTVQAQVPAYFPVLIDKDFMQDMAGFVYRKKNIFFQTDTFSLSPHLCSLIRLFMEEAVQQQQGYEFVLQSLNTQIAVSLLREIACNFTGEIESKKYYDHKAVNTVIDFLMENCCDNFTLDSVAKAANYSPYHLIRIFKEHTGKTPFEYFLDIKIERAKHLLKSTRIPVIEVGFSSGFNNRTHFSNVFKQKVGVSPQQYRKQCFMGV